MTTMRSSVPEVNGPEAPAIGSDALAEIRGRLREIFADSLSLDMADVPGDRPFLEIATSSLALVSALQVMSETFGVRPSLRRVFEEFGTIDRLAVHVAELVGELPARPAGRASDARSDVDASILAELRAQLPAPSAERGFPLAAADAIRLPLTAAQEELLFLAGLRPEAAAAWHEVAAIALEGPLSLDKLRGALNRLVERHDGLRARVVGDGSGLTLDVDPAALKLTVHELDARADEDRLRQTIAWLQTPLALETDRGLVRFDLAVFPHAPGHHVLRVGVHALVADRSSLLRLVADLGLLYTAGVTADDRLRMQPALSLSEFQRAAADTARAARVELAEFWSQRLSAAPLLDLPSDRVRPAVKRYAGDRIVIPIDFAAVRRSTEATGTSGAPVHVAAVAAAWAARLTGDDDLVLGLLQPPLVDRPLLANRTNPLPVRVAVDDREPFAELRKRTADAIFEAIDHGELPFTDIVRAVNPDRDQGRSPIFTLAVSHETWPDLHFGNVAARLVTAPCAYARYDVALTLVEGPGFGHLQCDYSTELFDRPTMRRYLDCLRRLLAATVSTPACAVGALPLISPEERARMVAAWNQRSPAPAEEPLFAAIDAQAARTPTANAIVDGVRRLTYAELTANANRVAHRLIQLGVQRESRVAILMDRSLEAIVGMLGVLKAGGAFVAIDPAYPPVRVAYMLADSGAKAVLADAPLDPALASGVTVVTLSAGLPELAAASTEPPAVDVPGGSLAYLIYTSGSTGMPKGVAIEHRAAVNLVSWALTEYNRDELAGVLASTSFGFDLSIFEIFVPLACGGMVILSKQLQELPTLPARDRVTLVNTVPSLMRALLNGAALPPSVRVVNLAGEPVPQSLVDTLRKDRSDLRVVNLYGPSETTTYSTVARLDRPAAGRPPIGHPIGRTRVYVLDRNDEPVPPGVTGELCVGGAGLARGYIGSPEITARKFVADPFVPGERMFRTGDLARQRMDGELEFLGRRDRQVKVHGVRIELDEIEACLLHHHAIREVAVLAIGDGLDRRLVAWTVLDPERASADRPDLRAYLREQLPAAMVPTVFVELPALPRLPNGKVNRHALPAPEATRDSRDAGTYAPPASAMERTLAEIWSAQLGVERIGRDDGFFDLGGHSLLLVPILMEIGRRFGVRVTLAEFFDSPTIAKLAARIRELSRDRVPHTRLGRRIARTGPEVDAYFEALRADAVLDPALQLPAGKVDTTGDVSHLFITGVTGFVGAYTFHELLRRTKQRFTCLVRATDADDGRQRLVSAMKRHDLWDDSFAGRFSVVGGELSRPRFGLDAQTYARLTQDCDATMHLAAHVNFIYPYRALKAANVDGTHEVVRFCFSGRPKPLHHVSTAAIWPMGATFRFREDDDINHGVRLNIGYDDSKWVAEQLVLKARERGLPVTIYRPGEVAGHSATGRCALDHFMWAIVKGSIQMRAFPEMKSPLDIAPIDYIAAAIAVLSADPGAAGGTYHLNNPRPADPDEIHEIAHDYGYPFAVQPFEEWVERLLTSEKLIENALYPFAAILEEFEEENMQLPTCDTARARAALAGTGVVCPPVAAPLIRNYLDYLVDVGYLSPPTRV